MSNSSPPNPTEQPLDHQGQVASPARVIDEETGLEYADLAARFLREPLDSRRNNAITSLRAVTVHPESVEAFWRAYDAAEGCEHTRAAAGYAAAAGACHPNSFDCDRYRRFAEYERARVRAADFVDLVSG